MPFEKFIPYRSNGNDASLVIISRFARILRKGFVNAWVDAERNEINEAPAPLIVPVAGVLKVDVTPGSGVGWVAISDDGMVIREQTSTYQLNVVAGTKNYIVLRAKYNSGAGAEIVEMNAMTNSAYTSSGVKSQLIIVGTIDIPALATDATTGTVSYEERDRIEGFFDTHWRPSVATFADLPTIVNDPFLKEGDMTVVRDSLTIYGWDGSGWLPSGGLATIHASLGVGQEPLLEYVRSMQGSGVLSGPMGDDAYARIPALDFHDEAATARTLGIGEVRAVLNGHFVKTKHTDLLLDPKPGAGERYDLVFLEAYRLEVVNPSTVVYDEYTGGTLTPSQISDALEELTASSDENALSFDISSIEWTHDNKFVLIVYAFGFSTDITLGAVEDPYDFASYTTPPVNSDGAAWTHSTTQSDPRLWIANHTGAYDGKSWAIPLAIVKRTSAEAAANHIRVFRSGSRFVFPVYPECDFGGLTRKSLEHAVNARTAAINPGLPSGVLDVDDYAVATGYPQGMNVVIRGKRFFLSAADSEVPSVPASPAAGGRRDLVYAECRLLIHPDQEQTGRSVHPLGESRQMLTYGYSYLKEVFAQIDIVMAGVGEVEDVDDAFTALGFSRTAGDPGLWEKADAAFDDRVNVESTTFAIPIAMVPRFNSGVFAVGVNPSGGSVGTRPDGLDETTVISEKIVQVSHLVALTREELKQNLNSSIDALMRGTLKTRIQRHPSHAGVAGASVLFAEAAAGAPIAGFTLLGAAPDGLRHIWSAAEEVRPFGATWDTAVNFSDGVFTWVAATNSLNIVMPPGMAIYVTNTHPDVPHFVAYFNIAPGSIGIPFLWDDGDTGVAPNGAAASIVGMVVNASDSFGFPTDLDLTLAISADAEVRFYFWAVMKRSDTDIQHQINGGLTHPPDRVYSAAFGPGPTEMGIGPMGVSLSKVAAGAAVTFSAADLAAGVPEVTGVPRYRAFLGVSVSGTARSSYTYSLQMSNAQDSMTITFSASMAGKTVHLLVAYDTTTVDRWVEFSRGSKAVSGFYSWVDIEWTSQLSAHRAMSTGSGVHALMFGSLFYRNTASANPWDLIPVPEEADIKVYEGSDLVLLRNLDAAFQSGVKDYRFVGMVLTAPAAAGEDFALYYEGVPYQGLSEEFSAPTKVDAIKERLQGEVLLDGKSFITTAGYAPQYVFPASPVQAMPAQMGYDQVQYSQLANKSIALPSGGQSLRRLRTVDSEFSTNPAVLARSLSRTIYPNGLDAVADRLPWPDVSTQSVQTGGNLDWEPGEVREWNLAYNTLLAGGNSTASSALGGGILAYFDEGYSAEEVGARRPSPGLTIGYGSLGSTDITSLETAFFADGDRGVTVTHLELSPAGNIETFVADGVAFVAPGTIEGLYSTELDAGVIGFEFPAELPTFLTVGAPWRLNVTGGVNRYYGGYATFIRATSGPLEGVVCMQVAGSPREASGAFPASPYALQIGGVFDAFWPKHRPLLPVRKTT